MSSCLWNVWKWYRNMSLLRFSSFSFLLHSILLQVIHDCIVLYTISFFFLCGHHRDFFVPGDCRSGYVSRALGKVDMFGFAVPRVIRGPCYGHGEKQIIIMSHSVLNIWKIIGKGNNLAETSEVETRVLSPEKYFV